MSIAAETAALATLLSSLNGIEVYTDPDAAINPPAILIGPPELSWTVFNGSGPDQGRWLLYLIAPSNGNVMAAVEPMIEQVAELLFSTPGAPTIPNDQGAAVPGSWTSGGVELPAYIVTIEGNL